MEHANNTIAALASCRCFPILHIRPKKRLKKKVEKELCHQMFLSSFCWLRCTRNFVLNLSCSGHGTEQTFCRTAPEYIGAFYTVFGSQDLKINLRDLDGYLHTWALGGGVKGGSPPPGGPKQLPPPEDLPYVVKYTASPLPAAKGGQNVKKLGSCFKNMDNSTNSA